MNEWNPFVIFTEIKAAKLPEQSEFFFLYKITEVYVKIKLFHFRKFMSFYSFKPKFRKCTEIFLTVYKFLQ